MLTKFMGLPEAFSDHGPLMDHMLDIIQWLGVALGVGWSIFFVIVIVRFWRGRHASASYAGVTGHTSTHLEIGVVIVEAMLLLGFAFPLWSARVDDFPDGPDVVHCRVIAYQFNWLVHYPGADGIFGKTDPRLYSGDNPYGVVKDDPNGADDVFQTSLYVPEGHPVVMWVTSKDVIHNVAIPALRVGLDAIPGTEHRFHFTATQEGEYDIICGQLCGEGHAQMRGACVVVSEKEWAGSHAHYDNAVIAPPGEEQPAPAADEQTAAPEGDAAPVREEAAASAGEAAAPAAN